MDPSMLFRRQFLLSPHPVDALPGWKTCAVGTHTACVHPDLPLTHAERDGRAIVLLGYLFDAARPEASDAALVEGLLDHAAINALTDALAPLAGTFVVVQKTPEAVHVVHDAGGLQEVFHASTDAGVWAASQPNLLGRYVALREHTSADARAFFDGQTYARSGRLSPGASTPFENVRHLPPNHALDLRTGEVKRYWPTEVRPRREVDDAAPGAVEMLRGFVDAAARRYALSLAVTAGWDSRMLLAASRAQRDEISYFVIDHQRPDGRPDVRVARRLADRLGISVDVYTYGKTVDPEVAATFEASVSGVRADGVPLLVDVFGRQDPAAMTLNGNVSEIARQYFPRERVVTPEKLAFLIYGAMPRFAVSTYRRWLAEAAPLCDDLGIDVLDLFYWEERIGNWAAKGRTEAHLVTDVFSPFDSRDLITRLLSVDAAARGADDNALYRAIMQRLWPEVLAEPFNPRLKRTVIKWLKRWGLYPGYRALRRAVRTRFTRASRNNP